ncbi:hypothetical protein FBY35_6774 [Streptomyces sp. SLBN-118]|uniref:hypothetical protein n=1 Tax=Streptomyces sp. SLBN-118 TaxID=2768454 RepID=UPI0011753BB5|nr:hypothetical protein [Streptomyces sp. SLBN-118]TQK45221.1 hypothetical protein FBY35_6774 [Streptomyces sp. SLBN-118]
MTTSRLIAVAVLTAAALFPAYAMYGPRTGAPTVQAPGAVGGRGDCPYGRQSAADTHSASFGCRVDA